MPVSPTDAFVGFCRWRRAHVRHHQLLCLGVLLPLGLCVVLAVGVYQRQSFCFDLPLLYWIRTLASPNLDAFFVVLTQQGYWYGLVGIDVLIVLILLGQRRWYVAGFAGCSLVGAKLLNIAAKHLFQRERPMLWETIAPAHGFSFPSAHAMDAMAMLTVLLVLLRGVRWRGLLMMVPGTFVLLLSASRLYLGVHYPSDILGGWSAALVWVIGLYLLMFRDADRLLALRSRTDPECD
ncbi:phosphatase PAP2 family protein [Xylella fastidiosa]|uniref:undecaprenyl-diphosphate phosphatase n=1 Tax=Xylella fastidiosa subsp. multiplex TaxID=644357 RepID=A0A9Q4MK13_XYLFS|nr:phosphatase PAP2 family protein [Xylella fastidiosa]ERI59581.1 membrane protein [Xylella fastidiosa subsp. multiplex Griffin-1]ACA13002.1 phosphatidylglycerophosphatase B [Xylella fastidiosa M12]KAJ4853694.1 phosphatase PAP2 family protein [Xylella fastidiosa subsp. multiplex]MBE0267861.1 phosphatase PAP2 family protein [Xylella fastidiosa subsp. multiplex]MBE0274444.1 phosphatase PAP2 family protein [Xylella fastidiosa subsp. multiplex]